MTIATETHLSTQKCFFCVGKKSPYIRGDDEKAPLEVSSLFGQLKMSENLEESVEMLRKIWNLAKNEYQQQLVYLLLNPGTYERIIIQVTTLINDSPLLILTTSSSIVSVHLFHDQSVTNAKTIFVPNTTKLQFYWEYNGERETAPCL